MHFKKTNVKKCAYDDIAIEQVHLVITDNASNMVKAMRDVSLPHFECFAHSLQLVINDKLAGVPALRAGWGRVPYDHAFGTLMCS